MGEDIKKEVPMPVSKAILKPLPKDVYDRLKEDISKTSLNVDNIKKCTALAKKRAIELSKEKGE